VCSSDLENRPEAIIGEKPATPEAPTPTPETHPLMGLSMPNGMMGLAGGEVPMDSVGMIG
jgi:hypothetical protein